MGGLGSGRQWGSSRYLATDACYGLDLAALTRAGYLVPGKRAEGAWKWHTNGAPEASAAVGVALDLRDPELPSFLIDYRVGEDRLEVRGELVTTQPRYGGVRYWFQCPRCWRRCRVLYAHPESGRTQFACRRCQVLRYYSHRESREDRLSRKARKLWRRAGSRDGAEPWQKPKWMRWATFSRLVLAGRAAQEAADGVMYEKLGAGLAKIQAMRKRRAA